MAGVPFGDVPRLVIHASPKKGLCHQEFNMSTQSVEYEEAEANVDEIKVLDAIFLCSFDDFNDRQRVWRTMEIHMDNCTGRPPLKSEEGRRWRTVRYVF